MGWRLQKILHFERLGVYNSAHPVVCFLNQYLHPGLYFVVRVEQD